MRALLRMGRQRPSRRCAANQLDKIAPAHCNFQLGDTHPALNNAHQNRKLWLAKWVSIRLRRKNLEEDWTRWVIHVISAMSPPCPLSSNFGRDSRHRFATRWPRLCEKASYRQPAWNLARIRIVERSFPRIHSPSP